MSRTELALSFAVIALGFFWFVRIASRKQSQSWRLKTFFLGGANVGPDLTEQNTLGITFAWSGGIWFFVTLSYHFGPWVLFLQLPWCLSIFWLAYLLRRILPAARNHTIHGYLGDVYGRPTQFAGAIATSLGYFLNTGFELFWAGLMFATAVGRPELTVPVAFLLSVIGGLYCSIGGYIANAATDRPQNLLGVVALGVLAVLVPFAVDAGLVVRVCAALFAVGSLLYVTISLRTATGKVSDRTQSRLALVFGVAALIFAAILTLTRDASGVIAEPRNSLPPLSLLVGIISFQLFFNIVDMANWQQIAANGEAPASTFPHISWSLARASLYLLWFPALGGVILGTALRYVGAGIDDSAAFTHIFANTLPESSWIVRGLVFGVLFLGLLGSSLSTADSMAMSATQTLAYDIFLTARVRNALATGDELDEREIVRKARGLLILVSIGMVLVFWLMYLAYGGDVFNFQTMMYSWALTLFPSILVALYRADVARRCGWRALWSISAGVLAVTALFAVASSLEPGNPTRDWALQLMPIAALSTSGVLYSIGVLLGKGA